MYAELLLNIELSVRIGFYFPPMERAAISADKADDQLHDSGAQFGYAVNKFRRMTPAV